MRDDLHEKENNTGFGGCYSVASADDVEVEAKSENTKKGGFVSCLSDGLFYFLVLLNLIWFLLIKKTYNKR